MEILHFCPSRSFSGLEQYALEVAVSQKKKGKAVGFVVCPNTRLEEECLKQSIEIVRFDPYALLWPLNFWPRLLKLLKNDRELKILHLHSTQEISHMSLPIFLMRNSPTRPKVILQSHIWINHKKKDPFHQWLYTLIDEFWCSSEAAKASLKENLPVPFEKFKIVPYGRDVEMLSNQFLNKAEARKILRLPSDAIILGSVSRLEESKGVLEFLEASKTLLENNVQLHVAIIGGPTQDDADALAYAKNLEKRVSELEEGIKSRIHLLGPIPQSNKYLKAFDVYVLPSHQETFSLSLLDAQLAGLPVVGSRSGGTPDVVKEGVTGWLFKPKDVMSLREKLNDAIKETSSWSAFGERAAITVRQSYNQKTVFENILTAYGSIP